MSRALRYVFFLIILFFTVLTRLYYWLHVWNDDKWPRHVSSPLVGFFFLIILFHYTNVPLLLATCTERRQRTTTMTTNTLHQHYTALAKSRGVRTATPPTCFGSSKTCVIDSCIAALCMSTSQRVYRSYCTMNGHDQRQHINYGMAKAAIAGARGSRHDMSRALRYVFFLIILFFTVLTCLYYWLHVWNDDERPRHVSSP
jgi:hypothetical protein